MTNRPEQKGVMPDNLAKQDMKKESEDLSKKYYVSDFSMKNLLTNRTVWKIVLGYGIPWATTSAVISQLVLRLLSTGHFDSPVGPVMILSSCTVIGLMGSFCWGLLDTRFGTKPVSVLYNLVYVVLLVLMMFLHKMPVLMCVVCTACILFTGGGILYSLDDTKLADDEKIEKKLREQASTSFH